MRTIGLTGAAGCGKSTVLKIFMEMGWAAVDADAVCARLHSNPESEIHTILESRWGTHVTAPDGTTDKKTVAEIVFGNESERKWLESVLHPCIRREIRSEIERYGKANLMLDAPLLFECGWQEMAEKTVAVWSPFEIQLERLLARGWSRDHALSRIRSQMPAEKKLELADYGIINHSSMEYLKEQCVILNRCLNP